MDPEGPAAIRQQFPCWVLDCGETPQTGTAAWWDVERRRRFALFIAVPGPSGVEDLATKITKKCRFDPAWFA